VVRGVTKESRTACVWALRTPSSVPKNQRSTHHVVAVPVQEVEVVVVHQVGCIKDALLSRWHVTELLAAGCLAKVGRVEGSKPAVMALWRGRSLVLEGQDAGLLVDVEAGSQQLLVLLLAGGRLRSLAAVGRRALVFLAQVKHAVLGI